MGSSKGGCLTRRGSTKYLPPPLSLLNILRFFSTFLLFLLTAWFSLQAQTDPTPATADDDGDGLIEVWNLEQLDHMRHNLGGTSYKATPRAIGVTTGCPGGRCKGYELMNDLDFRDADAAGYQKKWVPLDNATVASGNIVSDPANGKNDGWIPIIGPSGFNPFTGIFDGNGHVIRNLYIRSNRRYVGLFGYSGSPVLRNLGLTGEHMLVNGLDNAGQASVGGLVGEATWNLKTISNCYVTGNVKMVSQGRGNAISRVGGLMGNDSGAVTKLQNCYTTGNVEAIKSATGGSSRAQVGGLVGAGFSGTRITNCYATGRIRSTATQASWASAGGLIGHSGTVNNSYYSGVVKKGTSATIASAAAIQTPGQYKTEAQLKTPTDATGIYSAWSTNDWVFGSSEDLPRLRIYKEDADGEQVAAGLIAGQGDWSVTADDMVAELRALVDDYTNDVDKAVSGETYVRVKKLVQDVGKIEDRADKSALANYLTEANAEMKYALKAEVGAKPSNVAPTLWGEVATKADIGVSHTKQEVNDALALKADKTALGTKPTRSEATLWEAIGEKPQTGSPTSLWAAVEDKAEASALSGYLTTTDASSTYATTNALNGKADKTALGTKPTRSEAALWEAIGEKPQTGSPTSLWAAVEDKAEASALSGYLTTADASSTYATTTALNGKADASASTALEGKVTAGAIDTKPASGTADTLWEEVAAVKNSIPDDVNVSGKADKATTYTRTAADEKFALKSAIPAAPDLSGYVSKADFDAKARELEALKKKVEALEKGGGGNASALATAWLETRVTVKPNPVRDRLLVSSPVAVVVTLLDSAGRSLWTRQLSRGEQSVDVSDLAAGSYLLVIQPEEGGARTYKFVRE